jgi:hypothetical protein
MKFSITILTAALASMLTFTVTAQSDLFEGVLNKEEPVFTPVLETMQREGVAKLVYYFTHPRATSIEASIWIKDLGPNLAGEGEKRLVRGLKEVGNRNMDTILIDGLKTGHFYAIGVDYRYSNSLARKFSTKVLREAYRFEKESFQARSIAETVQEKPQVPSSVPCVNPDLFVKIDPAGYCGTQNRPAVLIRCENCHGKSWEFSVEAKTEYGNWQPLRSDGMAHSALGASVRTEPLCVLSPGTYYLRVLAWGENCKTPVINTIGTGITIGAQGTQPVSSFSEPPSPPSYNQVNGLKRMEVPASCGVVANAQLEGTYIKGSVELPVGSDCADWRSHVMITYSHPGYRDINLEAIPLYSGIVMPFEIELDQQDMQRGIHTLKAIVYITKGGDPRPIPAETFWIRAEENNRSNSVINPGITAYNQPSSIQDPGVRGSTMNSPSEYEVYQPESPAMQGTITKSGVEWEEDFSIDPSLYDDEQVDALQVTATDPNCTQILDLQLVASPTQPTKPLYVSWLSPRCCQEEGCEYSVWAGKSPQELSLVVKGNKPGATVSELLPGNATDAQYYEIVVRTSNGTRKAAYIAGQGPIYGVEAVLSYRDRFQPQKSDPVVGTRNYQATKSGVGGGLENRMGGAAERPADYDDASAGLYRQPQMPISKFRPCKYKRETMIEAELPVYEGDEVKISYDFKEPGHQYTLYHQPQGESEWYIAPGTTELQSTPEFDMEVMSHHSGKYLMLIYKSSKNWGCLSAPMNESFDLNVIR